MSDSVWLLRHGDTEWTEHGLHTGRQEVPLSDDGREQARSAGRLLSGQTFDHVLVSPQARALETCRLAGLGSHAQLCEELVEWDYGEYEGLTDEQTEERHPGWNLFNDGAPGGESPQQVESRIASVLDVVGRLDGSTMLVGHSKMLRALGACWLGCGVEFANALPMDPAALSALAREQSGPELRLWNVTEKGLGLAD